MPYITPASRELLDTEIDALGDMIDSPGELIYVITKLCHRKLKYDGLCCRHVNELLGVLEYTKMELYRTVAGPYEDQKRALNGPVSELDDDSHERMT